MKPVYLKIILVAAILGLSCTTKVSEWFLLNAVPDDYMLVYYHRNPVSEAEAGHINNFKNKVKSANIVFHTAVKQNIDKPYYALYYNNRLFSEYDDINSVMDITSSPLRDRIASELIAGKLCVMLYLTTGIPEKDTKGLQIVENAVRSSPFGDIISIIKLDRANIEENHLVSLLLNVESDLKSINEPMLFGVFGRFRVLEPLLAKGISIENIHLMIDFLTADCSCLIKDNLPGVSMLCNASWEEPRPALVNEILDRNPNLIHH